MRPSQTILVLEKLRNSSSTHLLRKGVRLSSDDSQTALDVYQQWILLITDLGYLNLDSAFERNAQRLWIDLIHADVLDLNNAFAECLHLVRVQNFKGFKALCKRISTHLYQLLKDDSILVTQGDVLAAKRLVQVFSFTGRLSLKDIDLTQQMLEDYLATEEAILPIDETIYPLIDRLNKVIKRWLEPFDASRLSPRHGRKGVAKLGRASYERKYNDLSSDQLLEYAFGKPDWIVEGVQSELDRTSKTIFVPKSYKSFRTISMEPTTLMYFQQGIWSEIDRLVLRNPYLRKRLNFHDQERNKVLACSGSISRNYATIDLSAASDSVSYELVKKIFYHTKVYKYLVVTRSQKTSLPNGDCITLKKFAPMGSAVCFPVETLIFSAACELVTQELRVPGKYSVFGDDIIVPTHCVDRLMDVLKKIGFRVNRDKSFTDPDCWFRESCGGEFCDGYDVTPLRVSRKYASVEQDVRLSKWIDTANEAYKRGFRNLRQFYLKKIVNSGLIPLFSPSAILADNYTNYHTKQRWNPHLQRIEVKVKNFNDKYLKKDLDSQDESIRLRHWLESTQHRDYVDFGFQSVVCKPTKLLMDSWAPKPYEDSDQVFIDSMTKRCRISLTSKSKG